MKFRVKTSLREVCCQGQGNFEFIFEVTLNEDSQIRELDFNVVAGFTNKQLMKTLLLLSIK